MPRYSPSFSTSLKVDVSQDMRERFVKACERMAVSQAFVLRAIIEGWVDEVERESNKARTHEYERTGNVIRRRVN